MVRDETQVPPNVSLSAVPGAEVPSCVMVLFGLMAVAVGADAADALRFDGRLLAAMLAGVSCGHLFTAAREWRRGRSFAALACAAYGIFWLSLVALVALPRMDIGHPPQHHAFSAYLAFWGFFGALLHGVPPQREWRLRAFFAFAAGFCFFVALATAVGSALCALTAGICGLGGAAAGWREAHAREMRGGE